MAPSLPLLSCESSVTVKENPDRKKKKNHIPVTNTCSKLSIIKTAYYNECENWWSALKHFSKKIILVNISQSEEIDSDCHFIKRRLHHWSFTMNYVFLSIKPPIGKNLFKACTNQFLIEGPEFISILFLQEPLKRI